MSINPTIRNQFTHPPIAQDSSQPSFAALPFDILENILQHMVYRDRYEDRQTAALEDIPYPRYATDITYLRNESALNDAVVCGDYRSYLTARLVCKGWQEACGKIEPRPKITNNLLSLRENYIPMKMRTACPTAYEPSLTYYPSVTTRVHVRKFCYWVQFAITTKDTEKQKKATEEIKTCFLQLYSQLYPIYREIIGELIYYNLTEVIREGDEPLFNTFFDWLVQVSYEGSILAIGLSALYQNRANCISSTGSVSVWAIQALYDATEKLFPFPGPFRDSFLFTKRNDWFQFLYRKELKVYSTSIYFQDPAFINWLLPIETPNLKLNIINLAIDELNLAIDELNLFNINCLINSFIPRMMRSIYKARENNPNLSKVYSRLLRNIDNHLNPMGTSKHISKEQIKRLLQDAQDNNYLISDIFTETNFSFHLLEIYESIHDSKDNTTPIINAAQRGDIPKIQQSIRNRASFNTAVLGALYRSMVQNGNSKLEIIKAFLGLFFLYIQVQFTRLFARK